MSTKQPLSVTIITLNEERNIARALRSVQWADEILVVDSGSVDRTVEIAQENGARVIHNPWPGYGQQKNFAQLSARNDWILNIDADEEVSTELADRIRDFLGNKTLADRVRGLSFPRKTFYLGRWIRHGGWYPNFLVRMADRRFASWSEPHIHEALEVRGEVLRMELPLHHFTFHSIQDQILANLRYSKLGSQELRRRGRDPGLFFLLFKPLGKFLETYFLKRGFLDGMPGFIISVNAAHSMFLKYAYIIEAKINRESAK